MSIASPGNQDDAIHVNHVIGKEDVMEGKRQAIDCFTRDWILAPKAILRMCILQLDWVEFIVHLLNEIPVFCTYFDISHNRVLLMLTRKRHRVKQRITFATSSKSCKKLKTFFGAAIASTRKQFLL